LVHDGNGQPVLIEAKQKLNLRALGQILGYTVLFARARDLDLSRIRKIVVCHETVDILEPAFEHFGVEIKVLNPS